MVSITVVEEDGIRRVRLLDEETGAREDVIVGAEQTQGLDGTEVIVEDQDDLSGRHHYSP